MKFRVHKSGASSLRTSLLIMFGFEKNKDVEILGGYKLSGDLHKDFTGKFRASLLQYAPENLQAKRLLLIGLGKKSEFRAERLRRAAALAYQKATELKLATYALALDSSLFKEVEHFAAGAAIAEGSILGSYSFDRYKTEDGKKKSPPVKPKEVHLLVQAGSMFAKGLHWGNIGAQAQSFARDLCNLPSNAKYPSMLAREAQKLAQKSSRILCRVFDEKAMEKMKMGALLGVARGSAAPPRLVMLRYRPRSKPSKRICFVGKGITFDTGGISLKPGAAMDEMKYDMSGAAAVLGVFHALRQLDFPHEVIGLAAITENMPDGNAQKPGDIVTAYNGITIEVLNTDAEGRMVLADALSYAVKNLEPDIMIDLATLTGAVVHALGHEITAVFTENDQLAKDLIAAGENTAENVWRMPMTDVHKDAMKSNVADLKNVSGSNVGGGACTAAGFLSNFVGKTTWAHLDIAGSAWGGRDRDYYSKGSVGVGVRLLLEYLRNK